MANKVTSKLIKEFFKKEVKTTKCAVCGIKLSTYNYKIKTMEFENGLIKNFIKDKKETLHHKSGVIKNMDGSEIVLCIEHFNTAWALRSPNKTFNEIIKEIKDKGNIVIIEEDDPIREELKKEISEKISSGSFEE